MEKKVVRRLLVETLLNFRVGACHQVCYHYYEENEVPEVEDALGETILVLGLERSPLSVLLGVHILPAVCRKYRR
jgi:hypothetical protein